MLLVPRRMFLGFNFVQLVANTQAIWPNIWQTVVDDHPFCALLHLFELQDHYIRGSNEDIRLGILKSRFS